MTGLIPHITKRDGIYQYHRRVPAAVIAKTLEFQTFFHGKKLFRKSLGTKDSAALHAAAAAANDEFDTLVAHALGRARPKTSRGEPPLRKLTDGELEDIRQRFRTIIATPFEKAHLYASKGEQFAAELARMIRNFETDAEEICAALDPTASAAASIEFERPAEIAARLIQRDRIDAPTGTGDFGRVVAAVRAGIREGYARVEALNSGTAIPVLPKSVPSHAVKSTKMTIEDAINQYIAFKKTPPKTLCEVNLSLTSFQHVVGNKRLDDITPADFRSFAKWLSEQTVGGKDAKSVGRPISKPTAQKRISFLRSAIGLAIDRGDFAGVNPAIGLNLNAWFTPIDRAIMPSKRPFTIEELNKVFQHPWFKGSLSAAKPHQPGIYRHDGMEYWAPIVALYTGMRAAEIAGLKLSEIVLAGDSPHFVVTENEYRRIKNGHSRKVPILDGLICLGFAHYVNKMISRGEDRLFPDWQPRKASIFEKSDAAWSNARLPRTFNRTVIAKTLDLKTGIRQEVTFHNLRSSFKHMLNAADIHLNPNIINEVVGHAKSDLDKRYVGTIPIEVTYGAIHALDFKGLSIPHLDS